MAKRGNFMNKVHALMQAQVKRGPIRFVGGSLHNRVIDVTWHRTMQQPSKETIKLRVDLRRLDPGEDGISEFERRRRTWSSMLLAYGTGPAKLKDEKYHLTTMYLTKHLKQGCVFFEYHLVGGDDLLNSGNKLWTE